MSQIKSSIIENQFLRIKSINIGASLYEVFYKPKKINLILNLGNYKNYLIQNAYVGSTCGRVVNRIRNSQFSIGGKKYNLVANEGKSSLHGGIDNFSYRIWKIEQLKKNKIIYSKDKLMEERVKATFMKCLGITSDIVTDELEYAAIPQWDSVAHMSLIVGLEDELTL